ncbi:type II toxin-antitoxin system VapB family antitoxin [Salana multivorans]
MANVLIRNIDDAVIAQIDADALRLGLSRNEYLRRALESLGHEHARRETREYFEWIAETFAELRDKNVRLQAWHKEVRG